MKEKHSNRKNIAIVATTPKMIRFFLVNHVTNLSEFYNVTVISNFDGQRDVLNILPNNIRKYSLPISREISIFADIKSLLLLMVFFYKEKFSVVFSISPKGGLLSMIAAWFMSVPVRIHAFTGQVWVTNKGVTRWLLKFMDRITSFLSTVVIVDSPSQKNFLVMNKIVSQMKSLVLGSGSISGVDKTRFRPRPIVKKRIRYKMNTNDSTIIFLFVGRLKKDKGVFELIKAFTSISSKVDHAVLWFVGDDEDNLLKELKLISSIQQNSIKFIPYTTSPEEYMLAADVFCLPSYREGFGSTIIESASCGIPSIGSRIYGITDAIIDGETGILVEKGDVNQLALAMLELANNCSLRIKMGESARKIALEKFDSNRITDELMAIIKRLVDQSA
ncbi:glycosyltransferase family 4 protein [Deltaproteobacteria bacterium]|nr:glycosyltransferase family 4 protein [Deltaproteobacteria bacterium]